MKYDMIDVIQGDFTEYHIECNMDDLCKKMGNKL